MRAEIKLAETQMSNKGKAKSYVDPVSTARSAETQGTRQVWSALEGGLRECVKSCNVKKNPHGDSSRTDHLVKWKIEVSHVLAPSSLMGSPRP